MNLALWAVQALLALAFLAAGSMKLAVPVDQLLANGMSFVAYTPEALVRFIGACEVAGALGLVLPSALRVAPRLTPLAAALLALVMLLAAGTHLTHGEAPMVVANAVLGGLAAFVAWGRLRRAPVHPRRGG